MADVIQKPIRPGTVIRFVGETIQRILPSLSDIVAVPITHDWGPINTPTLVTSDLDFDAKFGSGDTAGRRAVQLAFLGQGGAVGVGAGGVLVVRMAGASKAKASATLTNTSSATPALRLRGKYEGKRGERISYTVADDPAISNNDLLTLYLDGVRQERYSYPQTNIAALGADINARSRLVDADGPGGAAIVTGTALTATNVGDPDGPNLTAGDDGATLTGTEWLAAQQALETQRFSVIAPYNLTDTNIRAAMVSWVKAQEVANRPIQLVIGGDGSDTITTALARSAAIADPHVINLGVGTYTDDFLSRVLSTAELAPRVAGALVSRGITKSLTFAQFAGLHPVADSAPDNAEIEDAIRGGVTVFSYATSANADLKVEMGLTTFTSTTDPARPYDVYSDPRLIRIMDLYVRGMKEWGDENIIGGVVNQDARDAVYAEARGRQTTLEDAGLLVPGTAFVNVPIPTDPQLADSIPYDFGWQFARTANFVFGNGRIR